MYNGYKNKYIMQIIEQQNNGTSQIQNITVHISHSCPQYQPSQSYLHPWMWQYLIPTAHLQPLHIRLPNLRTNRLRCTPAHHHESVQSQQCKTKSIKVTGTRDVRFGVQGQTNDSSHIDWHAVFMHYDRQVVTIPSHEWVTLYVYRIFDSDINYDKRDTEYPNCTSIIYTLIANATSQLLQPSCTAKGTPVDGQCVCQSSYAMGRCEVQYGEVGEVGDFYTIAPSSAQYHYYKPAANTQTVHLPLWKVNVSIKFESTSSQTQILTTIQHNSRSPTTIASIYNMYAPSTGTYTLQNNSLLLITIYQPPTKIQTYYHISITLSDDTGLLVILVISFGGFFGLLVLVVCIFYWHTKLNKKNKIKNIIVSYEGIFPTIKYGLFVKHVGRLEQSSCVICLEEFVECGKVKYTLCSHLLHGKCLDEWLDRHENCPLCREDFTDHGIQKWEKTLHISIETIYKTYYQPTNQPYTYAIHLYSVIYDYHHPPRKQLQPIHTNDSKLNFQ